MSDEFLQFQLEEIDVVAVAGGTLSKLPLWADFSKSALQNIFKMVFFSCGGGP